jgi:hypothetical protein
MSISSLTKGAVLLLAPAALFLTPALLARQGTPAPATQTPPSPIGTTPAQNPPAQNPVGTTPAQNPAPTPPARPATPPQGPQPTPADPHGQPHGGEVPPTPPGPPGKLDCPVTDHEFGNMIEGEIAKHTFDMKSTGDNPLIITAAKPTCGCTISHVKVEGAEGQFVDYTYGDPILTGKKIQIQAELNTKNAHGTKQSKINVYCNDPRSLVTLGLSAMVDTYFAVTPPTLDFGDMSTSDTREKSAQISSKKGGAFKLRQEFPQTIQGVKVELTPVNPDAEGKADRWDVKITCGPDCREGSLGYPVQLRSDQLVPGAPVGPDGQAPAYGAQVMIQARVRGLISFEPQYLSFGLVKPGVAVTRTLKLSSFDPNFTLSEPKSMKLAGPSDAVPEFKYAEYFEVKARPAADGKTCEVDLTLKGMPESVDGSFQGRLLVETGHSARPTISVLFSGVCRAAVKPATPPPTPTPPTKQ